MNEETLSPEPPPSFFHRVFMGSSGIRAGWSIGIFILLLGLFTAALVIPMQFYFEKDHPAQRDHTAIHEMQPLETCVQELAGFIGLLAATMVMARIEHKPLIHYGLEGRKRIQRFLSGALAGVAALSVLAAVLQLCGALVFDGQQIFGWEAVRYALAWSAGFFFVGLYEEYFLRGYLQATLARGIGFWWSALILSVLFGCSHLGNMGESSMGILSAALVGFVFCISLWYLKSLWWAIGFHASWDWAQSYLWGTADSGTLVKGHLFGVHPQGNILLSGGATGPEGSVLIIPLLLIIAGLMWLVWGRKSMLNTNDSAASAHDYHAAH